MTMNRARLHGLACYLCDEPVEIGQRYEYVPKETSNGPDGRVRRAIIHTECSSVAAEVSSAATDLARDGWRGNDGDPLPRLMSRQAVAWINSHRLMFRVHVSYAATLRSLYK